MISPITKNENTTLLSTIDSITISKKWKEQMGIDVGNQFRSIFTIEFWQCNETGFRWFEPNEVAGEAELYSQLELLEWYYMPEKWEFISALKLLTKSDHVLEVGVGFGFFLEKCRNLGINVSGIELNPSAAKRSRENGFEIFEESLNDLVCRIGENRFDVICSFQVLEHISQPREFLESILRNLKIGGRLILSVPNSNVMRKIDPENQDLLNQPPHHMGHWDEKVFESLQNFLPLKLKSVQKEPLANYHVSWMVIGFLRALLNPFGKNLSRILINRYTTLPFQWVFKAGLRKFCPGHTILVEFEKIK